MTAPAIRDETKADRTAAETVVAAAFGGPGEAHLVAALREGHTVLALVADHPLAGIVGHVMFSRLSVEDTGGSSPLKATALAPVAVMPDHQRTGLGTALIEAGLARLRDAEEDICFVLGDPAYYVRFGFDTRLAAHFDCDYAGAHFMARALRPVDVTAPAGRVVYPAPFAALE